MKPRSAIVIVIDRLRADYLGPYGNAWIETPAFNEFAAESVLIEHCIAESPDLQLAYRSYWQGIHATEPSSKQVDETLMTRSAAAGLKTKLVTDVEWLAKDQLAKSFEDCVLLRDTSSAFAPQPAASIEDTRLLHLFQEAATEINQTTDPSLIWVHANAMNGPWSAPQRLRERFVGEGDPDAPLFIEPPHETFGEQADPDKLLALSQAYAAEILVLDTCLDHLVSVIAGSQLAATTDLTVCLTSPRGYALGEHGTVGAGMNYDEACLHAEVVNTPLIMRLPTGRQSAARRQVLAQNSDLFTTLGNYLKFENGALAHSHDLIHSKDCRPQAVSISGTSKVARTIDWSWISHSGSLNESDLLYAKPDDRHEFNNVASLCGEVIESLERNPFIGL